jgi:hypothetical protein
MNQAREKGCEAVRTRLLLQKRPVPPGAVLENPFLGLKIDIDDPKAPLVAIGPFEVVQQGPDIVSFEGHASFNGSG